jgi:hypothetical protein
VSFQLDWGSLPVWGLLLKSTGNEDVYDYNTACGYAFQDSQAVSISFTPAATPPPAPSYSSLVVLAAWFPWLAQEAEVKGTRCLKNKPDQQTQGPGSI